MLTAEHLNIYEAFDGDIDAFARQGETGAISNAEWRLIEKLRQELHLVSSGLASESFSASIRDKLLAVTESEQVRARLWALSK